jgi:hypothetical protein
MDDSRADDERLSLLRAWRFVSASRPLKDYLRWQYCVKNRLGKPLAANALQRGP